MPATGFLDRFGEFTHEKALKKRSDVNKMLKNLILIILVSDIKINRIRFQNFMEVKIINN